LYPTYPQGRPCSSKWLQKIHKWAMHCTTLFCICVCVQESAKNKSELVWLPDTISESDLPALSTLSQVLTLLSKCVRMWLVESRNLELWILDPLHHLPPKVKGLFSLLIQYMADPAQNLSGGQNKWRHYYWADWGVN
jgi:hypothetical protein